MTSPRGVRRNIYPYDASDPNLKWCGTCDYPYMPAGGCDVHVGRCLTCCGKDDLANCLIRMSTDRFRAARLEIAKQARMERVDPAQVQAEIDSLYGPPGGQR